MIFFIYPHLSYFWFLLLFSTMGKEIVCFYKHHWPKLSTPTLKKPILSSSVSHTSSASNSTWTSISSILDNKWINTNQNKNNISNTDDIQYCVTPGKKSTMFRPHIRPLIWCHSYSWPASVYQWHAHSRVAVVHSQNRGQRDTKICPYWVMFL